jgi:WXXGXW repeat (2 copies)
MSVVGLGQANTNDTDGRPKRLIVLILLLSTLIGTGGCAGYYSAYPGYGPYYGPGPYYGGGSVAVAVGDRPYYRGPGYWYGRVYYVWKPGHWAWRNGQKVWIRGHYVARGY